MRRFAWVLGIIAVLGLGISAASAQGSAPADATQALLGAFGNYDVVAVDDAMNIQQAADFYTALVTNSTFAANVGNVVIDFGDAAHQDIVDQYVAGQDVADSDLQQVWAGNFGFPGAGGGTGATQTPAVPESYAKFLAAIRQANQSLPDNQKIHVWPGAQANPQQGANGGAQATPEAGAGGNGNGGGFRGAGGFGGGQFLANLIETQILSQGKKALVIGRSTLFNPNGTALGGFGGRGRGNGGQGGGAASGTPQAPGSGQGTFTPPQNVRQILDKDYPGKTIVAVLHRGLAEADCNTNLESVMASWKAPVVAVISGTQLQTLLNDPNCHELGSFGNAPVDEAWADGYLYLGPVASLTMSPTSDGQPAGSYLDYVQQMVQLRQQFQQQFQQTPEATQSS